MTKKTLILTWSYGWWHNTAAHWLKKYYEYIWYEVKIIDIIDQINKFLAYSTKKIYKISSENYPKVWEKFFNSTDYTFFAKIFYSMKDPVFQPKFDKLIQDYNPNNIISVFPFWNWFLRNNIKKHWKNFNWGILITDAIKIQSFWYVAPKYVDQFFVLDEFSKNYFSKQRNINKNKITVSFFPFLKEDFIKKSEIKNKKILLLLTWLKEDVVIYILNNLKWYDITILKWRNENLYNKLKTKYEYKFLDFLKIFENLKNYDIMIWKPGWAVVCECIATDTPLIVPSFLPWQEEWNLKLLQYSKTWIYEPIPENIVLLIKNLNWNNLLKNFYKIKKSNSCEIIDKNLKKNILI